MQSKLKKQTPNPRESPFEDKGTDVEESTHSQQPVGIGDLIFFFFLPEIPITK